MTVPSSRSGRSRSSIPITNDGKTNWYGYGESGDDRPMIIKGTLDKSDPANPTILWQEPATDVGAPAGLTNIVFPTVVAGDPDRAAFIFHGTTTEGDSGDMASFQATAEWYLYAATTFDGGATWELNNITPNDPTQKGSICDRGTFCGNSPDDRNLLDFMDADIDGQGRIVVGYADGCVDACVSGGPATFSSRGYIARQVTGKRILAAFDPPPPSAFPASPSLTGSRNPLSVNLNWTVPAAGASPITGYTLERAENSGSFRVLAKLTAAATKYEDTTAIAASSTYQYRVSAANLNGTGTPSNVVAPPLPTENICVARGLSVLKDGTGDTVSVVTLLGQPIGAPVPAAADLTLLTVGEPYLAGGQLSTTFQLKTASSDGTLPPDSTWFTSFRNAANVAYAVRMVTDSTGVARFESYTVAADGNGNFRGDFVSGTPKAALAGSGYAPQTGLITVIVPAADVGVASSGESIRSLLAISTKLVSAGSDSFLSNPLDLMPNDGNGTGSVQTVPVATCGPNHAPVAVLQDSAIGPRKNL